MLKNFTFCDPARQELTGHLRLLVWGARILQAQSGVEHYKKILKKYNFWLLLSTANIGIILVIFVFGIQF